MARNVIAMYDDFQAANLAVQDLVESGIPRDNISIIANNARGQYDYPGASSKAQAGTDNVADETGAGVGVGAGIGAAIGGMGGLLVGLGALTIPGIGPVIAAGPLAVALSTLTGAGVGAVAGGVTGGLLGALIGLGVPQEEAEYYAEGVRRGAVLVTVQAEEHNTSRVVDLLNRHSPVDMRERVSEWQSHGWTKYDPNARPVEDAPDAKERSPWQPETDYGDFDALTPRYRSHYQNYLADTGYPYDYYAQAYLYGHGLASNLRYTNNPWDVIEPDVQHDWEKEHPGTWERFKAAIRYAWEDMLNGPDDPDQYR